MDVPRARETAAGPCDPHAWRAPILLTLALIGGALGWTMWLMPAVRHLHYWFITADAWSPLYAGRYVSAGAYPYMYEAERTWVAGPLLPVLVAPVASVLDALGLTSRSVGGGSFPVAGHAPAAVDVPYPSIWVLYCSYSMALCGAFLVALRRAVWELVGDRSAGRLALRASLVVCVSGLSVVAVYWMHVEDVLGMAMLLFAIVALRKERWIQSAILCGVAMAFKQWMALPVLVYLPFVPRREMLRFVAIAAGIPAVLYGIPLLAVPTATGTALFHAMSDPWLGHAAPWVLHPAAHHSIVATPGRLGWVAVTVLVAWRLRDRTDTPSFLAGVVVVLASRMTTESVLFPYYLFGVITFASLLEIVRRRSVIRSSIVGAAALVWFSVPPGHAWWWFVELALVSVLVWPGLWVVVRRSSPAPDGIKDAPVREPHAVAALT